jgi:CHAT domain-containing protein/tetratricopeptide (TPR) repeat protein
LCLSGALTGGTVAWAQSDEETPTLVPGEALDGELTGGRARTFIVESKAGDFLNVAVDHRGIDVVLAVLDANGGRTLEVDASPGLQGIETLAWIADAPGPHRLEIRPRTPGGAAGSFTLRLDVPRAPEAPDRERAAAERAHSDALRQLAETNAEPRRNALAGLEAALSRWRTVGDRKKEAATLLGIARAHLSLSEPKLAAAWLEEALTLCRADGDRAMEAAALGALGESLGYQGLFDEALAREEAALAIWQALGSRAGEAETLHNMGFVHGGRWDNERAIDAYQKALAVFRALGDRVGEASALSNLGARYQLTDLPRSIELLREVLPVHRASGDRDREATVLANIGNAYLSLGEPALALGYFEEVLPMLRVMGNRRGEASVLHNMSFAFQTTGELAKARASSMEALALRRAVGDKRGEAQTLLNLGDVHLKLADPAAALESTSQALALARTIGERAIESSALLQIGLYKLESGDLDGARERCVEALALRRQLPAPKGQALAAHRLARVERARGDLMAAKEGVENALRIIESERLRFSSADLRASYVASVREIFELHVDVLMRLHEKEPSGGFDALAFQAAEQSRSRSLRELLAEARADIREGVAPELLARERALRSGLNAAAERRLRAPRGERPEAATARDREIAELTSNLERTEAEIRASSPRYAAVTQPSSLSLADVQGFLGTDTVLLEYFLGDERSFLWVITGDSFTSHVLPPRVALETAARRAHEAMSTPEGRWEEPAADLARMILAPVGDRLRRRIVVVADGALQYVPLSALRGPAKDRLVEHHEIVGLPSASTIALLRQEPRGRPTPSKTLAVLADPVFHASDSRVHHAARAAHGKAISHTTDLTPSSKEVAAGAPSTPRSPESDLSRAVADLGFGEGPLARLPFTRREARAILSGISREQSRAALDFDASQAALTDADWQKYRFVHFATHGFLNSSHPELSGLVLSLVDHEGRPQPGFLTAAAVFNLRLSADLVVLSGCRTALGKEIRGEGLVGLTRGFMYAGAPRVIASLWKVDDAATAALMTVLYQRLRNQRLSPAAALRDAQLSLAKQQHFRHPYYWAAFQLQGEWK